MTNAPSSAKPIFDDVLDMVRRSDESDEARNSPWDASRRSFGRLSLPIDAMEDRGARAAAWDDDNPSASEEVEDRPTPRQTLEEPDAETISGELGLPGLRKREALEKARRDFVRANHPDKFPDDLKGAATRRTAMANALVDAALKGLRG